MKPILRSAFCFSLILLASACSHEPPVPGMKIGKPYTVEGKAYFPAYEPGYDKVGEASWYGPGFHGKYTASGEVFNQNDMTAAHPTLPMPSIVRVTNLANGKSTLARINDRGPFKSNRIIDLSKATAMNIGLLSTGKVRVQYLQKETNEYIAQLKDNGNRPVTMEAFKERKAEEPEQIVESNVESTQAGQTVNEAAPIQSVSSENLDGSVKGKDLPDLTQAKVTEASDTAETPDHTLKVTPLVYNPPPVAEKRMIRDETGKPVHLQGATDHDAGYVTEVSAPAPKPFTPQKAVAKAPTSQGVAAPAPQARVSPFHPTVVKDAEASEPADEPKAKAALAPSGKGGAFIQVGSFSSEENAKKLNSKLSGIGPLNIAKTDAAGKEWWRVRLGPFSTGAEAASALDKVHEAGLADARIVH